MRIENSKKKERTKAFTILSLYILLLVFDFSNGKSFRHTKGAEIICR